MEEAIRRVITTCSKEIVQSIDWDVLASDSRISLKFIDETPELWGPSLAHRNDLTIEFIEKHHVRTDNNQNLYRIPISLEELIRIKPSIISSGIHESIKYKSLTPEEIVKYWKYFPLNTDYIFYVFKNAVDPVRTLKMINDPPIKAISGTLAGNCTDEWVNSHFWKIRSKDEVNGKNLSVTTLKKLKKILKQSSFIKISNLEDNPNLTFDDFIELYDGILECECGAESFIENPIVRILDLCRWSNDCEAYLFSGNPNMTIEFYLLILDLNNDDEIVYLINAVPYDLFLIYEDLCSIYPAEEPNLYKTYPDCVRYLHVKYIY